MKANVLHCWLNVKITKNNLTDEEIEENEDVEDQDDKQKSGC